MPSRYLITIGGILCFLLSVFSCEDKIDRSDIYTFTGQMASDYINSNPDLSKFARIMTISRNSHNKNSSTASSLLGTRGFYTVLAPDNHAIDLYFDSIYGRHDIDLDTLPRRVADDIVLNCVIDLTNDANPRGMMVMNFYEGYIAEATLDDHRLHASFGDWGDGCILKFNRKSRVIKGNIEVKNGYVHIVDRVITPGPANIPGLLREAENMRIFSLLLSRTSWADSLLLYEDKNYHDSVYKEITRNDWPNREKYPKYRMYGYTAFVEPDEVFQSDWGVPAPRIDSLGRMENEQEILSVIEARCRETYTDATDEDYTSQDNAVNRFVSYHLLNCKRTFNYLAQYTVQHYGYWWETNMGKNPKFEVERNHFKRFKPINEWYYYLTMGTPRRILKVTKLANTEERRINRHSYYDNAIFGTYQETSVAREGLHIFKDNYPYDNECLNGYYFPIDHVLLYDNYTQHAVLNERIRYDFNMIFPELLTDLPQTGSLKENGVWTSVVRRNGYIISDMFNNTFFIFPNYLRNMAYRHNIEFQFCYGAWNLARLGIKEKDIIFPLFPVPYAGNWEVRLSSNWSLVDVYIGEDTKIKNKMTYVKTIDNITTHRFVPPIELEASNGNDYMRSTQLVYEQIYDSTEIINNDKICRQHGIMKNPYILPWGGVMLSSCYVSLRNGYHRAVRTIIYQGYMDPQKTYYVWLHSHLNDIYDYMISGDYIELVPECIYKNRHEDIW